MTILDRYILRKLAGPFAFSISTITFFFIMRVLVDFLPLFASRNLDLLTILETFALSLGWILALTFPMSVLVAVVMTFGRLAQDCELDAMHASGVSFFRLLAPVIVFSGILTVALFFYNNDVLPDANHRLKTLMADIHKMHPTIAIREGVFMDDFEGYRLLVHEVSEDGKTLADVTVYVLDAREPTQTIHAPKGEVIAGEGGDRITIRLYDGEIHQVDREDKNSYFLLHFASHDLIFDDLGTRLERRFETGSRGDRELSTARMTELTRGLRQEMRAQRDSMRADAGAALAALRGEIRALVEEGNPQSSPPAQLVSEARVLHRKIRTAERGILRKSRDANRYLVEIHKKYAFPFACLVFVFLGAPLGAKFRRGGIGVPGLLSFLCFLLYYMASLGGEKLGDRGLIPPALGMWAINILLGAAGLVLVLRKDSRVPFAVRAP
jgi:lipopolysaccharide export system permease protein